MSAVRFPSVPGRSLLGQDLALPGDLPAESTLVIVAFQRWHQTCVDRWIEKAVGAGVPPTTRGTVGLQRIAVIELPVLGSLWKLGRKMIDGGMARDIANPDILARTITVYTDVDAFQRALSIPNSEYVHALVVTRDGAVLARAFGDPTDATWRPLAAALHL